MADKEKKKYSWAKGRKEKTYLVRLDEDIYDIMKIEAYKDKMTIKAWMSLLVRNELQKRGIL